MLVKLMLAQAQECRLEQHLLESPTDDDVEGAATPGECAAVSELYHQASELLNSKVLAEYVPPNWKNIVHVKYLHYEGLADFFTAREQLQQVTKISRNRETATWTGVARLIRAEKCLAKASKTSEELLQNVSCGGPSSSAWKGLWNRFSFGNYFLFSAFRC